MSESTDSLADYITFAEVQSGQRPGSYLVYTTGTGFPPRIESVPHAMKGIATVFMLALLTGIQIAT